LLLDEGDESKTSKFAVLECTSGSDGTFSEHINEPGAFVEKSPACGSLLFFD
jgi:hypothetical protein